MARRGGASRRRQETVAVHGRVKITLQFGIEPKTLVHWAICGGRFTTPWSGARGTLTMNPDVRPVMVRTDRALRTPTTSGSVGISPGSELSRLNREPFDVRRSSRGLQAAFVVKINRSPLWDFTRVPLTAAYSNDERHSTE